MKVDEELWKKAKIRAIEEDTTLTEILNEALEMRLKIAGKMEKIKSAKSDEK